MTRHRSDNLSRSCSLRNAAVTLFVSLLMLGSGGGMVVRAEDGNFFQGRILSVVVGGAAGGGSDSYARLLVRHLGKQIPGSPTMVVRNMPGAASLTAASFIQSQAKKDGSVIGAIDSSLILRMALTLDSAKVDLSRFMFLGSANRDVYLCIARTGGPVRNYKEMFEKEAVFGTTARGAKSHDLPLLLNKVLGTKMRLVSGYPGTRELLMALERTEIDGMCGLSWGTLMSQKPAWFDSDAVNILVQEDRLGHPTLNARGVPLTLSAAESDGDRAILDFFYSQNILGRPHVLPPGVPSERVSLLRKAYSAALNTSALREDAAKLGLEIDPVAGDEAQAAVSRIVATPPAIRNAARLAIGGE